MNQDRTKAFSSLTVAALACILIASCTTVNHLDRYKFDGATLAAEMRLPPQPKLDVHYHVYFNSQNPIGTALSIGTNFAKASSAGEAEPRMERALTTVDVPNIILKETFIGCATTLDAIVADSKRNADFLLNLEINEYGVDANSPAGGVRMQISLTARIYDNQRNELVWRRRIDRSESANPDMFGLGGTIGNVMTASALSNLSEAELEKGFRKLAEQTARTVARRLEDDLYKVRYRD